MDFHRTQPVIAATGTLTSVNAIVFFLSAFNIAHPTGEQVAALNGLLVVIIAPFLRALVTPTGKSSRLIEAALSLPPTSTIGEVEAKAADSLAADEVATVAREELVKELKTLAEPEAEKVD